jgi:hypothetical protein
MSSLSENVRFCIGSRLYAIVATRDPKAEDYRRKALGDRNCGIDRQSRKFVARAHYVLPT